MTISQLVGSTNKISNRGDSLLITLSFASDSVRYGDEIDIIVTIENASSKPIKFHHDAMVQMWGQGGVYSFFPPFDGYSYIALAQHERYTYEYRITVSPFVFQEGNNEFSASYYYCGKKRKNRLFIKSDPTVIVVSKSKDYNDISNSPNECHHLESYDLYDNEIKDNIDAIKYIIGKNINYPQEAIKQKLEDKVFVRFRIDSIGHTYGHEVVKGKYEVLNNEALRVAKTMIFPKPTKYNEGIFKEPYCTFPVSFKLPHRWPKQRAKSLSDNKTDIVIPPKLDSASMESDLHFTLNVDSTRLSDPKYREFLCIQRMINNEELVHYFPSLPIFDGDLDLFIRDNIRYPDHLRNQNLKESVLVYLEVDTEGNTFNHQVIRGSQYDELNNEALRVTRLVKFKKPSEDIEKPGEPVYTTYYIRVPFHE